MQSIIYIYSFDIIGITETWLSNHIYDNEIIPSGYVIFHKDRASCGGGVLLAIGNDIPCQLLPSPNNIEILCVTLSYSQPIMCCLIYIPPNSPPIYYDNLFDFFSNIDTSTVHIMLLGDFNLPDIDWNTLSGTFVISNQFCDFIFDTGLCQLINGPIPMFTGIL